MAKVFEKRFPDTREALEYIESAGWVYAGRKGIFRKYDKYTGSSIYKWQGADTHSEHRWILRLQSDGHVSLHTGRDNSIGGYPSLPDCVWPSLEEFNFSRRLMFEVNRILEEREAFISVVGGMRQRTFEILRDDSTEASEIVETPIAALTSKYSDNPMTDQEANAVAQKLIFEIG
ncbi:MAG: hypothetical protein AAFX93_19365 [Verrucomicrobiota bacterium]